jgi:glycosyltransferase involved in cell wall biosynthesis
MNVGWIAPLKRKCGIAFYSRKYADALSRHVRLIECDPVDFVIGRKIFLDGLSGCDCVHIQYESSFFFHGRHDFYPELCRQIRARKIITLHEIYRNAPGVFPRGNIRGTWPVKAMKEILWDIRHPHWAAWTKHLRDSFHADVIIVHSLFQKEILIEKGLGKELIDVVPLPIKARAETQFRQNADGRGIVLGSTGFINPLYDYGLLLDVLGRIKGDWRFVWVGGLRRNDDAGVLGWLEQEIDKRGWTGRFTITGWVPDAERDRLLDELDVYCAFFKERSSSESLADAIAAKKPIVATRIPLTEEIVSHGPVLLLAPDGAEKTAECISALFGDRDRRHSLERAAAAYGRRYSYEACAQKLTDLYERVVAA